MVCQDPLEQPAGPQKRVRAKHSRSRLGCGVCRIRRVRCDQTRPICNRCSASGWKCNGYPPAAQGARLPTLLPKGPAASPVRIEFKESCALRHFVHHTSKKLAGDFGDDFWSCLVLQASINESCIRHITVAMACLHSCLEPETGMITMADQLRSQALSHYGMGIRQLNGIIGRSGWDRIDTILMCSILCIQFEWRQQNFSSALMHLQGSIHVLQEWFSHVNGASHGSRRNTTQSDNQFIRRALLPVLAKMEMESVSLLDGYSSNISHLVGELRPDLEFSTLPEAKQSLSWIIAQAYLRAPDGTPAEGSLFRLQQELWSKRLDIVLSCQTFRADSSLAGKKAVQTITLRIWRGITHLMALKESTEQFQFDRFPGEFRETFELCEKLTGMQQSSTFTADTSVIFALYFIAFNAPQFSLRRKAIMLLETSNRHEGIWSSRLAAVAARKAYEAAVQGLRDIDEATTQSFWDMQIADSPDGATPP